MSGGAGRRARLTVKYACTAVGLVGVTGQSLISGEIWREPTPGQKTAVVTASVLGAAVVLGRDLYEDFLGRSRRAFRHDVAKVLMAAVMEVSHVTSWDSADIGVSAFKIGRMWHKPWAKRLKRIGRERRGNNPPPSNIPWLRGVGVIGRVWEQQRWACVDTRRLWAKFRTCTKEQWTAASPSLRMGLTYEQFLEIADKYGTVLGVPMKNPDGEIIGVVSIDAQASDEFLMSKREIRDIACDAAALIARMLEEG